MIATGRTPACCATPPPAGDAIFSPPVRFKDTSDPMAELHHECGVAAVAYLTNAQGRFERSRFFDAEADERYESVDYCAAATSRLIPQILLDIQNRGQLAAGMCVYNPEKTERLKNFRGVGTVTEVFQLNHQAEIAKILADHVGTAAIGHVRYATCGQDSVADAQPFERQHIQRSKWFAFGFNGQLANFQQLAERLLAEDDFHLARESDTEILMHLLSREISLQIAEQAKSAGENGPPVRDGRPGYRIDYKRMMASLAERLDGAYNIAFVSANGDVFCSRDPLGLRPLCYAVETDRETGEQGSLFAAASESVALAHLGFREDEIKSLAPGEMITVIDGKFAVERYAPARPPAHCFFEWIYFANVASAFDDRSVYVTRKRLGEKLADLEDTDYGDGNTIVVPVPDTAKAAADSMAYELRIPSQEGLIRNRYVGRTFIEGQNRAAKVAAKYTPLREVLAGKRVLLVEDTIVRSTTMRALIHQIRDIGQAAEIHVRVACPPIIAPCYYGIDMSQLKELFAPNFMDGVRLTDEAQREMAAEIGADSLRYLPMEAIAESLDLPASSLCQACINTEYPTATGRELYQIDLAGYERNEDRDAPAAATASDYQRAYDLGVRPGNAASGNGSASSGSPSRTTVRAEATDITDIAGAAEAEHAAPCRSAATVQS